MKQSERERINRDKEIRAMWQTPTRDETAAYVRKKLGRPFARAEVFEVEQRAIAKIKRELMKWMQERRSA